MIQNQFLLKNKLSIKKIEHEAKDIKESLKVIDKSPLNDLWFWKATITKLMEANIKTADELKSKTEEEIREILTNPLQIKSVLNFLNKI